MTNILKSLGIIKQNTAELETFRKFYTEYNDFVRTIIYWTARTTPEQTSELVQDTFVKIWKNFNKFKHKSSFKTWIYKIARNTALDYVKKQKKQVYSTIKIENTEEGLKQLINRAILKLTPKHREVFILFYKLEYSIKEIAKLLKISEGTVKSRLFYAKKIFKTEYIKMEE